MKAAVIIQARTDSSRFPNKVLQNLANKPMLWHVIERSKGLNIPVIVATTKRDLDKLIVQIAKDCDVNFFRGSGDDVLDRYYCAAKEFSLDFIIRITADCPLIDPKVSIKVLNTLLNQKVDYVGTDNSYPDGLDTEGFTFETLQKTWTRTNLRSQREHVSPYMTEPSNGFKIMRISAYKNFGKHRWTVDYEDDLQFVRRIYSELYKGQIFHMEEILKLLEKKPELLRINSGHLRNEGYAKSLKEDNSVSQV